MANTTESTAAGTEQAKAVKRAKTRYKLHLSLIANDSGETGEKAGFIAWQEGPSGLARRLGEIEDAKVPTPPAKS